MDDACFQAGIHAWLGPRVLLHAERARKTRRTEIAVVFLIMAALL
jgi:hypothetical protein